jgi:hypothetical protein
MIDPAGPELTLARGSELHIRCDFVAAKAPFRYGLISSY